MDKNWYKLKEWLKNASEECDKPTMKQSDWAWLQHEKQIIENVLRNMNKLEDGV